MKIRRERRTPKIELHSVVLLGGERFVIVAYSRDNRSASLELQREADYLASIQARSPW